MATREFENKEVVTYLATSNVKNIRMIILNFFVFLSIVVCSLFSSVSFASETVKFDASKHHKSKKISLRGELFRPKGDGQFPTVILMHGCGGWQTAVRTTLTSYAKYLVANGFAVLNLDSFGPRRNSGGQVCASYKKLKDAREYRTADAFDAMKYLKKQEFVDPNNIFLMGQSNGGSVAINVANSKQSEPHFRAVVAYYPWCGTFGTNKVDLSSPLLVLGGDKDDWVPPHGCKKVRSSGEELRVTIYPEAPHSFDINILQQRYMGKLIGYDSDAARGSQMEMLSFFNDHLTLNAKSNMIKLAQNKIQ